MNALLVVAFALALLNLARLFAEPAPDWFAIALNALVVIAAPLMGIAAARDER